jgi:two-component sensor histidine kinase
MRPLFVSAGVFGAGCLIVSALAFRDFDLRRNAVEAQHSSVADQYTATLNRRLAAYETFASLAVATFEPRDSFNPNALDDFAARVSGLIPDAFSMVWGVRVEPAQRARLDSVLASKGARVYGPTSSELPPADQPLYVNLDIEPPTPANVSSIGLALNSRSEPKAAIDQAVELKKIIATAPLRLVQRPSDPALVVYGPILQGDQVLGVLGFSFLFSQLMSSSLPAMTQTIIDAHAPDFGPVFQTGAPSSGPMVVRRVSFAGREYEMRLHFEGSGSSLSDILWLFTLGLLVVSFVSLVTFILLRNTLTLQNALASKALAEEGLRVLVAELNHRILNTCTVAIALARQSFKDSPEAFSEFQGRLSAMAAGLGSTQTSELRDIIAQVTNHFGSQIDARGGRIELSRLAAQLVPLAVHELMTNSMKHGAIGRGDTVTITWGLEGDIFGFSWKERRDDGSQVTEAPAGQSFGTQLLIRLIPQQLGGEASLGWRESAFRYDLRVPRNNVLTSNVRAVRPH